MALYDIPLICIVAGLILYAILGGADFGAGVWQFTTLCGLPRRGEGHNGGGLGGGAQPGAERIREHAHHSMGPVWEANHVWLIFVLTVTWTSFPSAFGAIASTLAVPLFVAGIGIVFRGAAYALRTGTSKPSELGAIDTIFSISSILTPFALGSVIGAIASQRVPPGNAAGHLISSWTGPTSVVIGVLAVAVCAYMAAVYLAADAARHGDEWLMRRFRSRALLAGTLAGAIALAGLPILHADAHRVFERLVTGPGLAGLLISLLGGVATLVFVALWHFEPARISAALAVAGTIIGWALAQQPMLLTHVTLSQAAAPHDTQVAVIAAIAMGAVILLPSLGLLFKLVLSGRFDPHNGGGEATSFAAPRVASASHQGLYARLAIACLLGGLGLLTAAEAPWAHGVGASCLLACCVLGFLALAPAELVAEEDAVREFNGRSEAPR